jgi:hypothetical protein
MSERDIIPFRVSAKIAVKAIDLALIPECGGEDIAKLRDDTRLIESRIAAMSEQKADAVARKIFSALIGLPMLMVIVGAWLKYYSIMIGIALTFVVTFAAFISAAISSVFFRKPLQDETTRALLVRKSAQEQQLKRLVSLERLTGKIDRANELRLAAEQFNANLSSLDMQTCSPADRALIAEKRFELTRLIGDFRVKVSGTHEVQEQLPNANDDRT